MNLGDQIASLVISKYDELPTNGKPIIRSNNVHEWTILAGIVIKTMSNEYECVSLATGVKALPDEIISKSKGFKLHDCHAEILCLRAFNHYCLQTGINHISEVWMYICAPPCGDASMSTINGESSWELPKRTDFLRGREHYNVLGAIRTKPGRADSLKTMSKSCTDKLCLAQTNGILRTPCFYVSQKQIYLNGIVTPQNLKDYERAFSRFQTDKNTNYLQFLETNLQFKDYNHVDGGKPTPVSIVWTPHLYEVLANGVKQGSRNTPSAISTRELVFTALTLRKLPETSQVSSYKQFKQLFQNEKVYPPAWQATSFDDFEF